VIALTLNFPRLKLEPCTLTIVIRIIDFPPAA
jgi:hypothetical protein